MGLVILGKLLGHKSTATTQRYAHLGDDPLKRTSEHIADTIMSALGAAPQKPPAES